MYYTDYDPETKYETLQELKTAASSSNMPNYGVWCDGFFTGTFIEDL